MTAQLSWTAQSGYPSSVPPGLLAVDPVNGVVNTVTSATTERSADGGVTWAPYLSSATTISQIAYGGGVWLVGFGTTSAQCGVWRSTDGGVTWASVSVTSLGNAIVQQLLYSPTLGSGSGRWVCAAHYGATAYSDDGGVTWSSSSTISNILGVNGGRAGIWDGSQYILSGRNAANTNWTLYTSTDGSTWTTVVGNSYFGSPGDVGCLAFNNGNYYIGGKGFAAIVKATTVAGLVTATPVSLASLLPASSNFITSIASVGIGFLVLAGSGSSGLILESSDGGTTWVADNNPWGTSLANYIVYDAFHKTFLATTNNSSGYLVTSSYVQVLISPATANVYTSQVLGYSLSVSDGSSVTWAVNGVTGGDSTHGTINAGGSYTAPATVPSPATVTVTATDSVFTSCYASSAVTVLLASISISPTSVSVPIGGSQQTFTPTVAPSYEGVVWSVNGIVGGDGIHGTIANGVYTSPLSPATAPPSVTVTGALADFPGITASATVTLTVPTLGGGGGPVGQTPNFLLAAKARFPQVFPCVLVANAGTITPQLHVPAENNKMKVKP